ncbi:MAG: FAD-dependent oxidoreductase [bacterium]|nr:FAD-dependent oxidoreductase [bacterium]
MQKYDLCITGGGPAGCACAYIASKLGLKTLLAEKNNYLGGLMTGGLVVPVMKTDSSDINTEFFSDLIKTAKDFGAQIEYFDGNKGWFNPNVLKIVLDKMLKEQGVDILFETEPVKVVSDEKSVLGIEFLSNLLSVYIESKYFLDSTGDSKIFQLLKENFFENDSKKQPASLRFIMAGINMEKFKNFITKIDSNREVTNFFETNGEIHLTTAYTWDDKGWNLKPIFESALQNGELEPFDTAYFQVFSVAGAQGSLAFNCPRLRDFDQNDPTDFSNALIEARSAIFRISKFMIKHFEGFENAYISQIADMTGFRETNKIIAKKQFTLDMLNSGKIPKNPVLSGDYPVDIHSNQKDSSMLIKTKKYYLEIDSLISKNYKNLYAAGRNLGADSKAQGALRTQLSCMSMGEGVARHVNSIINLY